MLISMVRTPIFNIEGFLFNLFKIVTIAWIFHRFYYHVLYEVRLPTQSWSTFRLWENFDASLIMLYKNLCFNLWGKCYIVRPLLNEWMKIFSYQREINYMALSKYNNSWWFTPSSVLKRKVKNYWHHRDKLEIQTPLLLYTNILTERQIQTRL